MRSIETDLQFCLETLGLNDTQTDEILNCCENLGAIPVEYFCEEFIFGGRDNPEEEINTLKELVKREHDHIGNNKYEQDLYCNLYLKLRNMGD